ncbi:hypothetical protein GGP89_001162 [Salinibacter ruber]|uniref:Glycosyltransferase RgtA/B/C/D-like domain-containing protein n=1 Tax=Salinibacter ruber TaxID=146919 RepID=A0A9X2U1Y7_9BACT|nr:glycosyltransferase family 39 protein [Salinibacter ruber]MCS3857788.1 hypothetical protein [Salinibacter ruber]MCS3864614.1 hypothetical protein [Salinibacter ruber]
MVTDSGYKSLAGLIPAIFLFPLVGLPIPGRYGSQKAVASYFQSVAFIEEPLKSFFYNTPAESLSSIHLYSIISSPVVKMGFTEGGRLVSLMAAVLLVLALEILCRELMPNVYYQGIAGTVVWAIPIFVVFSFSFTPDSITVLLTTLSVLFAVLYINTGSTKYIVAVLVFLPMGVFNHMWEAAIVVPIASIMVLDKKQKSALALVVVVAAAIFINWYVSGLQPTDSSAMWSYSIFHERNYELLLSPKFYIPFYGFFVDSNIKELQSVARLLMLLSVLSSIYLLANYEQYKRLSLLVSTWTVSGLSIPFVLPLHFANHYYDAWVFIVPVCLSVSLVISMFVKSYLSSGTLYLSCIVSIALLVILTVSPLSAHVLGVSIPGIPNDPIYPEKHSIARANDLKSMDIESAEGLLFVGEFAYKLSKHSAWVNTFPSHVLIYSGVVVRKRSLLEGNGYPKLSAARNVECRLAIYKNKVLTCK